LKNNNVYPKYKNKLLMPSKDASNEMYTIGLTTHECLDVLVHGFECGASKRAGNVEEKCLRRKNKIIKVVAVERERHWMIIHVGMITASRRRIRRMKKW